MRIKSDTTFIRRILTNLVNNAIQAMPNGGELELTCFSKKDKMFVTISDMGVGIPDHFKQNIFSPMMTTKSKGQGLGLAVAKRLVEAINGKIDFESELGKGTKFKSSFPLYHPRGRIPTGNFSNNNLKNRKRTTARVAAESGFAPHVV
jgi:signal transduction histidine kinase